MQALRFNGEEIVKRERESSPSGDDLELGLGINGGCGTLIKEEQGQVVFTRAQIQEFLLQAAIFRYIRSGLRVPISLVFPVWSSVTCSWKVGSVQRHFPSLATLFHRLGTLGMMGDPEPGRCRRTDGKKWRCSGSVVPNNKYCERHIHRGSNRSRKHVEASQHASRSLVPAVSTSLNFKVSFPSEKGDLGGSASHSGNGDWKSKGKSIVGDRNGAGKRGSVGILADKCNPKKNKLSIHQSLSNFNPTNTSYANVSNPGNNGSSDASFFPGFGYSPKSITQHSNATVSTRLELDHKIPEEKETEPHRCKRTDGKKWRCQRNVAPGKTTCERHMLRGKAKSGMEQRAMFESNKVTGTQFPNPRENKASKVENKVNLNTDLSIKGGNSSSSDATTMTDNSAATISI